MFYAVAIALAFVDEWIAQAIYVLVALMWLVPDKRIERAMARIGVSGASRHAAPARSKSWT